MVRDDGRLYHDSHLGLTCSLIPNRPFESCHAADLLVASQWAAVIAFDPKSCLIRNQSGGSSSPIKIMVLQHFFMIHAPLDNFRFLIIMGNQGNVFLLFNCKRHIFIFHFFLPPFFRFFSVFFVPFQELFNNNFNIIFLFSQWETATMVSRGKQVYGLCFILS